MQWESSGVTCRGPAFRLCCLLAWVLLGSLLEWGGMLLADLWFVFFLSSYLCGIFS